MTRLEHTTPPVDTLIGRTVDELLTQIQLRSTRERLLVMTYGDTPLQFFWHNDAWYIQVSKQGQIATDRDIRVLRSCIREGWCFIFVDEQNWDTEPYLLYRGRGVPLAGARAQSCSDVPAPLPKERATRATTPSMSSRRRRNVVYSLFILLLAGGTSVGSCLFNTVFGIVITALVGCFLLLYLFHRRLKVCPQPTAF